MPNELSYKDYPDGTRAYFRDDAAREQITNIYGDVASRVAANSLGSSVDITSSDPYTCPKDGYVSLVLANGAKGTVYVAGHELLTVSSSQGRTVQSVFVKAGTSVRLTDASGTKYLYYHPLQY